MAKQSNYGDEPASNLDQVHRLSAVSKRTTLSVDTIKRRYADLIVRLSPRRCGMTERNVRIIANGEKAA
jgi:hypothetical protein